MRSLIAGFRSEISNTYSMKIKSAEFVISNSKVEACPKQNLPEYAFIGRSNVGKSSLINMLLGRKNLAKTSGRPGKTQLINHFIVNDAWFLVDLPGYGYAKVSKKSKKTFQRYITEYFKKRKQLVSAFVLIDIRHEPLEIDLDFMAWLGSENIPFAIVFTKADKLKPSQIPQKVHAYLTTLTDTHWESPPPYLVTSSASGQGRDELLSYIATVNEEISGLKKV